MTDSRNKSSVVDFVSMTRYMMFFLFFEILCPTIIRTFLVFFVWIKACVKFQTMVQVYKKCKILYWIEWL